MAIDPSRTTREVLDDHLDARTRSLEEDLAHNYDEGVQMVTASGVQCGHDAVRTLASLLEKQVPNAHVEVTAKVVDGELAAIAWTAKADGGARVDDGFDTFLIKEGRIVPQSIHYTVRPGRHVRPRALAYGVVLTAIGFAGGWMLAARRSR